MQFMILSYFLILSTTFVFVLITFVHLKQDEDVFNERVRILSNQERNAVEAEAVVLKDLTKVCYTINSMYAKNSPRVLLYALICIKHFDAYACYWQPKPRSVEYPKNLLFPQPGHTPRPPHPTQTLAHVPLRLQVQWMFGGKQLSERNLKLRGVRGEGVEKH